MSDSDVRDDGDRPDDDDTGVLGVLSEATRQFLDDPGADAANEDDLPDDRSGVEVPQDGDPGR